MENSPFSANPHYVLGQISKTIFSIENQPDPVTRQRILEKKQKWEQVLQGMLTGSIAVGSRTPLQSQGVPAWVTLEVVQGGFATGQFLAGGPLQEHEVSLLQKLGCQVEVSQRIALNLFYLTEVGQQELLQMLQTGCYQIQIPEEGALLVMTWLISQGHQQQAQELLETIAPFFDRLRFYPIPTQKPIIPSVFVRRKTIGHVLHQLSALQEQIHVRRMKETITKWLPLYDQTVALFLETVDGSIPVLKTNATGKPIKNDAGRYLIEGGWPCQKYKEDFHKEAQNLLETYQKLRQVHTLCQKPEHPKENFARLRAYLKICLDHPKSLTGKDVGMIRKILASFVTKYGVPWSEKWKKCREQQSLLANLPTHSTMNVLLRNRLQSYPPDAGLTQLASVGKPVSSQEAVQYQLPKGTTIPPQFIRKVEQCLEAPIETLVQRGIIPSGEVLAQVLPQITSQVRAAGLIDENLRRLYSEIYAAFRKRRSLLLLNLESQVKLEELPWISIIRAYRKDSLDTKQQAWQTLEQVSLLAITSFPQTILPNKLLQEFRALAASAERSVPFVDELAADIFMGTFSDKFLQAAQWAGTLMQDTLYEKYFELPYHRVLAMKATSTMGGSMASSQFADLCYELAGVQNNKEWSVAKNGTILEQAQILTTQNLAALFQLFQFHQKLQGRLQELAQRCFEWICKDQAMKVDKWQARLQKIKNAAYAWRQMIFFLSFLPQAEIHSFLQWAYQHLETRSSKALQNFQQRFHPALLELEQVAIGHSLEWQDTKNTRERGQKFLGWTTKRHWLLGPKDSKI